MLQVVSPQARPGSAAVMGSPGASRPEYRTLLDQLKEVFTEDPLSARAMVDDLKLLLGSLSDHLTPSAHASPATAARGGLAPWQVRAVTDHVDLHLADKIHVDALAARARLSTSHFCRAFKISTGETAHTFVMRRRLEHAQHLMLNSDESLCQIAASCGLADQAHLTRLFRRYTGDTPYNWRRAYRTAA